MMRNPIADSIMLISAMGVLGGITIWILSNGFYLDNAIEHWGMVIATLGATDVLLENLTFLMPHIPLYLLIPFYYIPGLSSGAVPNLVSLLAAGMLLILWLRDMNEAEYSHTRIAILMALIVIHPAFLWAATSGGHIALSMIAFYLLYRAVQHVISEHDLRAYILLAVVFLVFFFIDASATFIFIALLPLMVIVAPIRLLNVSPMSLYLIIGTPFAFGVASWAYLNWIFEGSFVHFMTDSNSVFLGGMLHINDYPWLKDYGGQFFDPLLVSFGYMLIAYPVSVYLLLKTLNNSYHFRATFVLLIHPVIAIAIATSQNFLTHPFEILTLISAGIMAELTYVKMQKRRDFVLLVLFMLASVAGGWYLFVQTGNLQMQHWVAALQDKDNAQSTTSDGDFQLGVWLKKNRQPTLIYERSAYKSIVVRGDAKGLLLSFSIGFKTAMHTRKPKVIQIAVPDPHSVRGKNDRINLQFPNLYAHGMNGFRRIYDHLGWRVYRRKDARFVQSSQAKMAGNATGFMGSPISQGLVSKSAGAYTEQTL